MKVKNLIPLIMIGFIIACTNNKPIDKNDDKILSKVDTTSKFIPENFKEEIQDSLLDVDNNYRVIIKKTSRMDKFITKEFKIDSTHIEKVNYRDNSINIKVLIGNETKFDTTLTKEIFPQIGDTEFLKQAIMWKAWIISYDKENQTVLMWFNLLVPDTDWSYNFSLKVNKEGKSEILLEEVG